MIALDKLLLKNTMLVSESKSLKDSGFITADQWKTIQLRYPIFKTSDNILIRIGFFLLGILLYSSIIGAVSLLALPIIDNNHEFMLFVYSAIGVVISELLVRKKYYGHGLDDVFILGFQLIQGVAVGMTTESPIAAFTTLFIVGLISAIRYVNTISALFALIGITGVVSIFVLDFGIVDKMYLSFVMLFLGIGLYGIYAKLNPDPDLIIYKNALLVLQAYSLILVCLSVNYLVVRELSQVLMGIIINGNNDIPLSFVFYVLTFLMPVLYIIISLKQKTRTMFIIGLLALGFAIFSIQYYYSFMPPEIALVLAGILLFVSAYFCIQKLKHKESGITFMRDKNSNTNSLLYAQATIINSRLNTEVNAPEQNMTFGGGGFSGGGASESF